MFDLKFRFDKKQVKLEECQRDSVDFCQVLSRKLVLTIQYGPYSIKYIICIGIKASAFRTV